MKQFSTAMSFAKELDRQDPLKAFRRHFYIPPRVIYMDGNSLGLCARRSERTLLRVLEEWKKMGIRGWLEGHTPWFYMAEKLGERASSIVGAEPDEVVATGTTTVNIHSLISTFYNPTVKRYKIIADELNFPSDLYALKSQLAMRGLDPDRHLVLIRSQDGLTLSEERIIGMMDDRTALLYLPSVLYRSGQLLDLERLTREAHRRGILAGFDCCHSVGAVPHEFDRWGVDFAVWCSYKYLNSGPGSAAFLYINRRHFNLEPKMTGWFGFRKNKQFDMLPDFDPQPDAGGWQISSPGILGSSTLEGALELILEAEIKRIRQKSLLLTSYFMFLVDQILPRTQCPLRIVTPKEPSRRGGHVALQHEREAWRICEALKTRGIIPDFRPPDIIRIAPVALYNTFTEVREVARHLGKIIENKEFENFSKKVKPIS